MARIVTIANQKGGVSKTTTAHCLATGLTHLGYKVLAIDTDSQGNLTHAFGAKSTGLGLYEGLRKEATAIELIQETQQGDILPSTQLLTAADLRFQDSSNKAYLLDDLLKSARDKYNYIVIDTPPSLGILTINALTASNDVIIPMASDIFSIQGLLQLHNSINMVRKHNQYLKIAGILMTRFHSRTILNRDVKEIIEAKAAELGTIVYKTIIREGIAVRESQIKRKSLFHYAPRSKPAKDYINFINEYVRGV